MIPLCHALLMIDAAFGEGRHQGEIEAAYFGVLYGQGNYPGSGGPVEYLSAYLHQNPRAEIYGVKSQLPPLPGFASRSRVIISLMGTMNDKIH